MGNEKMETDAGSVSDKWVAFFFYKKISSPKRKVSSPWRKIRLLYMK